ncbi:hypothetical protein VTK26DRAFT_7568 [Humicola hyalothermophila]
MAGTDPRRSSRARTAQSQSQISSTASSVSGRAERSSRHFNKGGSPQKSTSTGSLSSEAPEDTTPEDTFGTRRRTRGQVEERERAASKAEAVDMASGDGDTQEEDEAVRCVCGNEEYQGPPPFDEDSKHGFKHSYDLSPFFSADVTDDTAGFFVQCDICKVWQHGGCVGIMTEESSPDEYFCEQCRQDLHKLWTASNGNIYSHYLPLKRHARTTSRAASLNKETARSPTKEKDTRNGRTSSANQTSKRRSTLNSREAGYDEAEALRRAIEASKEDALPEPAEDGNRRPKRGRSDSQEKPENAKRQRTDSRSVSPSSDKNAEDSDDARTAGRNGAGKSKARSSGTTRNQRTEKATEKEERERQRAETANKRKARADRRRAEDSDPSEEMPLAARASANKTAPTSGGANAANATATEAPRPPAVIEPPPAPQPTPDTPPTIMVQTKADKKRPHKKKGRNQYTRDRDAHDDESPARSQSRDIQKEDHGPSNSGKGSGEGNSKGNAKSRGGMSSKITMNDMKRRAAALLDFISRTQVELAGESLLTTSSEAPAKPNGASASASEKPQDGAGEPRALAPEQNGAESQEKDFKELGCMEMMDSLTRRLVKWQQQYAV